MSPENSTYIKEVDNAITYFSGNPRILIARDKTVQGFFNSSSINHQHQLQEIQNISLEIANKELKDISFEQSWQEPSLLLIDKHVDGNMCHVVFDGLFRYYEANKQGIDFKQLLLTSNTC